MPTATTDVAKASPSRQHGRDELNFALFPLSVLTFQQPVDDRGGKVFKHTFPSTRWDKHLKRFTDQSVTLKSNSEDGLPLPFDEGLTLCLLYLAWREHRFENDVIKFYPSTLLRTMHLPTHGRHYKQLEDALNRLNAVRVIYENAYWDKGENEYHETFSHGIVSTFKFYRPKSRTAARTKHPQSWVRWNRDFLNQLQEGILTTIDIDRYFDLRLPTARRMMRVVNRHFSNPRRDHYEQDLRDFAHGHVGLAQSYDIGQLKAKLNPGYDELQSLGIVNPKPRDERYIKVKKGVYRIAFDRYRDSDTDHDTTLAGQLVTRGVTKATAKRLVAAHPAESIQQKIELFDFLKHTPTEDTPKKPGGWLKAAIENDYQPPPHFKTRAQRDEEVQQKAAKTKAARQQREVDEQKRQQEQAARQQLFTTWRPVWEQLTEDEQNNIRTAAVGDNVFLSAPRRRNSDLVLERCFKELARRHAQRPRGAK